MPRTFNPEDASSVKRSKVGVWDLYEDVGGKFNKIPMLANLETLWESLDCLPYVWRMFKDIAGIQGCLTYLGVYIVLEIGLSLLPALGVWYSGQLLQVVRRDLLQIGRVAKRFHRLKSQSRSEPSTRSSSFASPSDDVLLSSRFDSSHMFKNTSRFP